MKVYILAFIVLILTYSTYSYGDTSDLNGNKSILYSSSYFDEVKVEYLLKRVFDYIEIKNDRDKLEEDKRYELSREHDEKDLLAQQQAAKAAISNTEIAKWQLVLSVCATIGLTLTIVYTRYSLIQAQNTTKGQLRPWIIPESKPYDAHFFPDAPHPALRPASGEKGPYIGLTLSWTNAGVNPAANAKVWVTHADSIDKIVKTNPNPRVFRSTFVCGRDKSVRTTPRLIGLDRINKSRTERIFVFCVITYKDPTDGTVHSSEGTFSFRYKNEYDVSEGIAKAITREDFYVEPLDIKID